MRLLIAEDEDSTRQNIYSYIKRNTKKFTNIYTAQNGQEAFDLILRYRPGVMLLDIQMPLKDGMAVLEEATNAGLCPRTIILSGHDDFGYAQKAIRYGVKDYLLKPCRSTELLQQLEKLAAEAASQEKPSDESEGRTQNYLVDAALHYMNEHYHKNITLSATAEHIGVSPGYLSTLFSSSMGIGFAGCLNQIRIQRACEYFVDDRIKTYEVAYRVGFNDEKYFSHVFKKITGMTPSQYRKGKH